MFALILELITCYCLVNRDILKVGFEIERR